MADATAHGWEVVQFPDRLEAVRWIESNRFGIADRWASVYVILELEADHKAAFNKIAALIDKLLTSVRETPHHQGGHHATEGKITVGISRCLKKNGFKEDGWQPSVEFRDRQEPIRTWGEQA